MDLSEFTAGLIRFIEESNNLPAGTVDGSTRLIESGYVDSFSIMQLILFIEEQCGVSIAIESLSLETITTPEVIAETYAIGARVRELIFCSGAIGQLKPASTRNWQGFVHSLMRRRLYSTRFCHLNSS